MIHMGVKTSRWQLVARGPLTIKIEKRLLGVTNQITWLDALSSVRRVQSRLATTQGYEANVLTMRSIESRSWAIELCFHVSSDKYDREAKNVSAV
jgi:hypothetical protein